MLIALLVAAAFGAALSIYTLRVMACGGDACDFVMSSRFARVFGFPNAALALAYNVALMAFASLRLAHIAVPLWPALAACAASLVMTAYLAFALLVRVKRT